MPIVGSVMQIAFYVTPIVWKPEQINHRAIMHYMPFNPFYSLLEIVRGPLLGYPPTLRGWEFAIGFSVVLCALGWAAFVRARARLAFWV